MTECIQGLLIDEETCLSLRGLCELCNISAEEVREMVDEGLLNPRGACCPQWRFGLPEVRRVQVAVRLRRDLRVNTPGAALVLDLLDEITELRRRLAALGM